MQVPLSERGASLGPSNVTISVLGKLPFAVRVEYPEREVCMRVIALLVFPVTFALVQPLTAQTAASCAPAGNIQFVCGQEAPEYLLHLPGSDWVIAPSLAG